MVPGGGARKGGVAEGGRGERTGRGYGSVEGKQGNMGRDRVKAGGNTRKRYKDT